MGSACYTSATPLGKVKDRTRPGRERETRRGGLVGDGGSRRCFVLLATKGTMLRPLVDPCHGCAMRKHRAKHGGGGGI